MARHDGRILPEQRGAIAPRPPGSRLAGDSGDRISLGEEDTAIGAPKATMAMTNGLGRLNGGSPAPDTHSITQPHGISPGHQFLPLVEPKADQMKNNQISLHVGQPIAVGHRISRHIKTNRAGRANKEDD